MKKSKIIVRLVDEVYSLEMSIEDLRDRFKKLFDEYNELYEKEREQAYELEQLKDQSDENR